MLHLRLVGACTLLLDPQRERHELPLLHVYLSNRISRECIALQLTGVTPATDGRFPLVAETTPHACFCAEIDAEMDFPLIDAATPQPQLDALATSVLNFDAYCTVNNVHNELCTNQAGCAMVALAELVGPQAGAPARFVRIDLTYPMLDPADTGLKGTLVLDTAAMRLTWRGRAVADGVVRVPWAVPQLVDSPLEQYIGCQEQKFGVRMPSTWDFMSNINMFEYRCRVGRLPVAAYIDSPLGPTTEAYYENAARAALRIVGVSEADALARWTTPAATADDCRYAAYWLAALLSLYVQSCDYLTDAVIAWSQSRRAFQKIPIEWFYQARVRRGTIDCEDASMETMVEALELERLRNVRSPLVQLAQRVKAAFYCVLLLDAVSAGEINLAPDAAPSHLDAHMNSALVAKYQFASMTRTSPCAEHDPSAAEIAASRCYPPIVMMEGTGPLDPNGVEHARGDDGADAELERAIAGTPAARARLRRIFHYDGSGKAQSGFYKAVKIMSTAELARRGCGRYLWMLCDGRTGSAGVPFQAVAAASTGIRAVAEDELTPADRALMDDYCANLHPQPALLAPSEAAEAEHMRNARAQVARLRDAMGALVRPATPGVRARRGVRVAKHHNFDVHGKLVNELIANAQRHFGGGGGRGRLVGFEAAEFVATPDRGFFHLYYDMEL